MIRLQQHIASRILALLFSALILPQAVPAAETVWEDAWNHCVTWIALEAPPVQAQHAGENNMGVFEVHNANLCVHFTPSTRAPIDSKRLKQYALQIEVKEISHAMSCQVDLDLFDAQGVFLRTISLFPPSAQKTLRTITLDKTRTTAWQGAAYCAPKLGLLTTKKDQQIKIGTFKIVDMGTAARAK